MSKHRERRIDRRTAERLLGGARVDVPDALAGLLAAAAAPPRDDELAGEQAATAVFCRPADHDTVPRPRSNWMIGPALAKPRTLKVAAAVAAICAVSGVAAVAATGNLTSPTSGSAPSSTSTSANTRSTITIGTTAVRGAPSTGSAARPSPDLAGLCHAYDAGAGSVHGKALDSPAFTALITAAGGRAQVGAYCTDLLSGTASAKTHATGSADANTTKGKSSAAHAANSGRAAGDPPHALTRPTETGADSTPGVVATDGQRLPLSRQPLPVHPVALRRHGKSPTGVLPPVGDIVHGLTRRDRCLRLPRRGRAADRCRWRASAGRSGCSAGRRR